MSEEEAKRRLIRAALVVVPIFLAVGGYGFYLLAVGEYAGAIFTTVGALIAFGFSRWAYRQAPPDESDSQ